MSRKRLRDESMSGEEEAKRMEKKYAALEEDYEELRRHSRALKQKMRRNKDKVKRLQAEVRTSMDMRFKAFLGGGFSVGVTEDVKKQFLQKKYRMFIEKDHEKNAAYKTARCELTGLQPLMSTTHHTSPEMVVTPAFEQANKKRDLKNNGLVSAQKPSKVKDGRKKKIKADLLVSPEYGDKSITISKIPNEPAEALAIEDQSGRHELPVMHTFSSMYDRSLHEMTAVTGMVSNFKVPHSSSVTPAVIDGRNEKIKAYPLVSREFIANISRRPKEPTVGLGIEDEPARHELMGMQPLASTDDRTVPEMTELQPSTISIMSDFKVPHGSLVTPTVKPANRKRRLENNALTSVQKPSNVKDGRNRKIKADPLVSPEFVARNISISGRPREPTEALAIEGETSRYELIGMQPLLPTDDCITILQPSDVGILTALPVPRRSLATPNVEDTGILTALPVPRRSLATPNVEDMGILTALRVPHRSLATPNVENMGILTAVPVPHGSLATPNVEDGPVRRELLQLFPSSSDACSSAEMTRRQRSDTRTMSAITQPARHESRELQLFPPSDACTSTEITGLQRSATRTMPAIANLHSSMVTAVVKPATSDQKPSKVKGRQMKKPKDNSQKPISLSKERGVESFWDN